MKTRDKINSLAEKGWHINIECYMDMETENIIYTAEANKTVSNSEEFISHYPEEAIGNNLEGVIDDLISKTSCIKF